MIQRLVIPYKDIYTTVYTVRTDEGVAVFDTGSSTEDAEHYVLPFLRRQGITAPDYIVISHNHRDHAPGLPRLAQEFPTACIVSADPTLCAHYPRTHIPKDGDTVLGVLQLWNTPGHDADCLSLLDTRTNTLLTGDSLQMYGIVSEFPLGAHLRAPSSYLSTLDKIASLPIDTVLTAHDYKPFGYRLDGAERIAEALALCRLPFERLYDTVVAHPTADPENIRTLYTTAEFLPVGDLAIEAMKTYITQKKQVTK